MAQLLWVDDEIELLQAHIIFLQKKGYEVATASNGADAIEMCRERTFDLILLDEMMPGINGLEVLSTIKEIQPATPVVMVTKSEEEDIMNQAIGQQIADYLIKPVNPNQILLTLKKNIHRREIVSQVAQSSYQQSFMDISMQIDDAKTLEEWIDVYKRLVSVELQLSSADTGMMDMLKTQKEDANNSFAKFIKKNYLNWVSPQNLVSNSHPPISNPLNSVSHSQNTISNAQNSSTPLMSHNLMKRVVFPLLDKGEKVFFIVIDNFRYDQWRTLVADIGDKFDIDEHLYPTILPTATQYARNAIFSGLMPNKIEQMFPDLWVDEDEEEGKNLNEKPLIQTLFERYRRKETFSYHKINDSQGADYFLQQYKKLEQNDLNVLVINFIDMLSHARTESKMVRELANNESAYRSITRSWFEHSVLSELFKLLSQSNYTIVLTTDHGSIRVQKPVKIIGDKNTNTNLRYKLGKNLAYNAKEVFVIKNPKEALLPSPNISTTYVFAQGDSFFAYPNNYNYYVSYFKDTFQHGGISMEEMLVPLIVLKGRK